MEIKNTVIQKDMQDLLADIEQIDDIGELINKAHLVICDLINEYLGKNPDSFSESDFSSLIVYGYNKAQTRANICLDYICQAAKKLQELSNGTLFLKEELAKENERMLKLKSAIADLTDEECVQAIEYAKMLKGARNEKD